MLLINFICLFYLMVLVRCDTISKSDTRTESYDGATFQSSLYIGQESHTTESTARLEKFLSNLKHRYMQHNGVSQLKKGGMVFATDSGYSTIIHDQVTTLKTLNNIKGHLHANEKAQPRTTTKVDKKRYLNNMKTREAKKKRRKAREQMDRRFKKNGFWLKDFFKHTHPTEKTKCVAKTKEHIPKPAIKHTKLPKSKIKSEKTTTEAAIINTNHHTDKSKAKVKSGSNKDAAKKKKNRYRRKVYYQKREPHLLDSRYDTLTNKLHYKDYVNGFKYYLNFERDMAKANFSDSVLYEAHKHHNVDDIGKFILAKIPQVPLTEIYNKSYETTDLPPPSSTEFGPSAASDTTLDKYGDVQTTTVPTNLPSLKYFKKRLIAIHKPLWLSKKSISSHSDSKNQRPRIRRSDNAKKSDTSQLKGPNKNVAVAKVHLVETSKTKKPFRGFFQKFKKQKSKRDTGKSILNKIKQIFSNGKGTTVKNGLTLDGFNSDIYDLMNARLPVYKTSEVNSFNDEVNKYKRPVSEKSSTLASHVIDYGWEPKEVLVADLHPTPEVPFELTTPPVENAELRKELHQLQREHDSVAAKIEADYEVSGEMRSRASSTTQDREIKNRQSSTTQDTEVPISKESTIGLYAAESRPQTTTTTTEFSKNVPENYEILYDEYTPDLRRTSPKHEKHSTTQKSKSATPKSSIPTTKWHVDDQDSGRKQDIFDDRFIVSSTFDIPQSSRSIFDDNPGDHYSIKPSMLHNFNVFQPSKTKATKDNINEFNMKTTPANADKVADLQKLRKSMSNMGFGDDWPDKIVSELKKLNKLAYNLDNMEIGKKNNDARDMDLGVNTSTRKNKKDVLVAQMSAMFLDNKETTEANDDYYIAGNEYFDEEEPVMPEVKDSQLEMNKEVPVNDLLGHDESKHYPYFAKKTTKPASTAKKPAKGNPGKSHQQNQMKNPVNRQQHSKTKPKKPAHPLTTPWYLDSPAIEDDDENIQSTKAFDKMTKVTSPDSSTMLDKWDKIFPWNGPTYEYHQKNLISENNLNDLDTEVKKIAGAVKNKISTTVSHLKHWLKQHDVKTSTKLNNIEYKPTFNEHFKEYKNNEDRKVNSLKTTTTGEESSVVDVGRLIKNWLTSTENPEATNLNIDKNGKSARQLSEENDIFETTPMSVNKNEDMSRVVTVDDVTGLPKIDEHNLVYTKQTVITDNSLFTVPKKDFKKIHGYRSNIHNPNIFKNPFSTLNNLNAINIGNSAPKLNDNVWLEANNRQADKQNKKKHPTTTKNKMKHKETEHAAPGKVEILETYKIIYTALERIPHANQSLTKVDAILNNMYNLKKRNLRKSKNAFKFKPFKNNKPGRRKRFAGVSMNRKKKNINTVRFNVDQDDGELKEQKRNRQITGSSDSPNTIGLVVLLVNCSTFLPRGNYLLKVLGDGPFNAVLNKRETNTTDTVDVTHEILTDDLETQRELDEKPGQDEIENKDNRRRRALNMKSIKKWFHGDRTCRCKCQPNKIMCPACAACDAVMMQVLFRLGNIINYINDHSLDIKTYFEEHPTESAKFRNAMKETDGCLKIYSKRVKGKCRGKLCDAFKYVNDRDIDD